MAVVTVVPAVPDAVVRVVVAADAAEVSAVADCRAGVVFVVVVVFFKKPLSRRY